MHSQFQRYSPYRPAAWRQERVLDLAEHLPVPKKPHRRRDDQYVREYYRFLQKFLAQTTEDGRANLFEKNPALFYAHSLHFHPDREWRSIAQGFLLTGDPLEDCADHLDTIPEALDWYEKLFFNVRDRLHAQVWVAKTVLGSAAYRAANRGDTVTENQQDLLFKMFGYYGGPLVLTIVVSGHRRGSLPRRAEDITPWYDDTFATLIRNRSTQAAQVFQVNKFNVMELMQIHVSIMHAERAATAGGPETDVEKNVRAFMDRIPWVVARKGAKDLQPGTLEHRYATSAIEPRADEQMALALGYVPEQLKLAEEAHDPSRIIAVETSEE